MAKLGKAIVCTALFGAASARADTSAERAEALFREARAAVTAGDYGSACPKFAESQRLEPAPGTLMNLADCEEHIGQIVAARNDYALAASGFARDDPRRAFVLQHATELEKRFAHLTIRLAKDAPAGTVVRRGRMVVDTFDKPVEVDPGDVQIVVTSPGRHERRYTVRLTDAQSAEQSVDVGAVEPTKTVVLREKSRSNTWRNVGFVVGSVGLAGVAVGALTGFATMQKADTVKAHCDAMHFCDVQGFDAAADGRVLSPISTISLIAGGALVLIGVTLVLWNPGKAKSPTTAMVF